MSIAEVKNLSFSYSGQTVLKDINFKISGGDFVALLGPNGSGKTTLIKILLGLLPSQKGKIILFDNALKKFNAWQNIGYLEQKTSTPRSISTVRVSAEVVFSTVRWICTFSWSER